VVAPGILFGFFAGVLHWYPKITGRFMSKTLNHLHFWPSLICMNLIFFPMLVQGMAGFHRRWYNGGDAYLSKAQDSVNIFGNTVVQHIDMNILMSMGAWTMAFFQIFFIINLFTSWKFGKKVESDNPWDATTLEWATPTPPGHGNFLKDPVTYRGPYEYSRPDCESDFLPQWIEPKHLEASTEHSEKH
jgi:cytochrome c oxidase subunit 1